MPPPAERLSCIASQGHLIFVVEDSTVDIRPKLFEHVEYAVQADLRSPPLVGFHPLILILRIVGVADACGGAVADDFRKIKGAVTGVVSGDEQTREGIAGAVDKPAPAQGGV